MKSILAIYISLFFTSSLLAQEGVLSKRVTFEYNNIRLKEALTDLTDRYQIPFSYSTEQVNVRQRITAKATDMPLSEALNLLFENIKVAYMKVGNHIVLRNDPGKSISKSTGSKQSTSKKRSPEPEIEQSVVLVKQQESNPEEALPPPHDSVLALEMPEVQPVRRDGDMHPFDETLLNFEKWRYKSDTWIRRPPNEKRVAQVSLLPFIGTNTRESDEVTNNVSMNLLWGMNGGVDGMEVGMGLNMIKNDMNGFQFGGLGNKVNRDMTGTQFGGIFNYAGGVTQGFQAAGVINFANDAQAAQAAGFGNIVTGDVTGLQASGVFNRVGGNAKALQASGLFNQTGGDSKMQAAGGFNRSRGSSRVQAAGVFNLSRGNTKLQIGGLFNSANDVQIGQIGGLFNRARGEMKGLQIGLINISDTVSGVPIGLINIVKRGYNKFEIYGSEILHGNFQLKLGANAFYNIFHVGARVPPGDGSYIWGLGYGIGTVTTLSEKSTLNWELMAIHISENETWTNNLNSIGEFRFLWNHQLGKSIGFFIGPTANVMVSQHRNPETGEIRSPVVPYTLLDEDLNGKTNLKAWVGVNAGFRF
ncbi:MAG: STN domain-containing protein [Saprospiraceae bacterium]|nr:STN domain-containing protein [Saprospiraceae bacterium]MCF8252865.1 STN domain-containing protein [Saprospiraceae bacterium]MCF8283316.1 STN domain-containing protein [Bacteroidales bacterium]MCF8314417.1 STN domain-containing protein [Saprospiraceae bacterium]MCF8443309.1 STN domain-containing protein [Saprospiraceae bacterium]